MKTDSSTNLFELLGHKRDRERESAQTIIYSYLCMSILPSFYVFLFSFILFIQMDSGNGCDVAV